MTTPPAQSKETISFGSFDLIASERLLTRNGVRVELGARAYDILVTLLSRPNEVISKNDLIARVWSGMTVDEGSLRFHVAGLRKALGDGQDGARYISTSPGQGYSFVAPLSRSSEQVAMEASVAAGFRHTGLPIRLSGMVGREDDVLKLSALLRASRFVTVVGAGGIGKTTLAVSIGHHLVEAFADAIFFIDFSTVADPDLAPVLIASMLGLSAQSADALPALLAYLREKRILLVFDTCEHLIEPIAALASRIFADTTEVHILATSQEALRVEGEQVYRLEPLACPPEDAPPTAAMVRSFPATRLFVERAIASGVRLDLDDAEASIVIGICRKLDGVALAIELAARCVETLGLHQTAGLPETRLRMLWAGARTAPPRQKTLQATLEWSHSLLTETECAVLRRLATLVGPFTLDAALSVAAGPTLDQSALLNAIDNLVAKSLIAASSAKSFRRYRLLASTRAFALGKLTEAAEADRVLRAHAAYFTDLLTEISSRSPDILRGSEFLAQAEHFPNVRAALVWSFSERGDRQIGVALASAAARFFLELSLLTECCHWSEKALASLERVSFNPRQEMELQAAFGMSAMYTQGNTKAVRAAFMRGLHLAEQLGDLGWRFWLLRGLNIHLTQIGDFRGALQAGELARTVAQGLNDPAVEQNVEWMRGVAYHLLGQQDETVKSCESARVGDNGLQPQDPLRFGRDDRIKTLVALARALWLSGRPDRAVETATYALREAERLDRPLTLGIALIWSSFLFLWNGDWTSAEITIERLIDHSTRHSLGPSRWIGMALRGELLMRRGEIADAIGFLRSSREALYRAGHRITTTISTVLAEALTKTGQFDEAVRAIDEAIAQIGESESLYMPEIWRVKGYILDRSGRPGDAEDYLRKSIELARRQHAVGWELRASITLGQLWQRTGRAEDVRALIARLFTRYEKGSDSPDLITARTLLKSIG